MNAKTVVIQPGMLKHTLILQSTTESYGNPGTWQNVKDGDVRCSMDDLSGSEPTSASGTRGENRIELEMRYRSDITYDKRFIDRDGIVFDIVSIVNVKRLNRKLIVQVIEKTNI